MDASLPTDLDVAIVGAGISGLVLGRLLAETNLSVAVLEQRYSISRNSQYAGLATRDAFGAIHVDTMDRVPVREIVTVTADNGWNAVSPPYADGDVFAFVHNDLLQALRRDCRERNVPVLSGATITELLWNEGAVSGVIAGLIHHEIRSRLVVLADESDPRLAELPGLRPDWPPTRLMHLAKARYTGGPEEIVRRFDTGTAGVRCVYMRWMSSWGDPVEAYIVPVEESVTVGVNFLLEHEMVSTRHVLEVLDEFKAFPEIETLLSGLVASDIVTEVVPVGWESESPRLATDGILLVGDVVGATNPLNRDGLSGNLAVCTAVAEVIREALDADDVSAAGLAPYGAFLRETVFRASKGGFGRSAARDKGKNEHPLLRTSGSVTPMRKSETLRGGNRPLNRTLDTLRRVGNRRSNT